MLDVLLNVLYFLDICIVPMDVLVNVLYFLDIFTVLLNVLFNVLYSIIDVDIVLHACIALARFWYSAACFVF